MHRRAALLLAGLLPLMAACGGRSAPELTAQEAFARLPEEVSGFRKFRPERGAAETVIARYASPNRAAASVHALAPNARAMARDGEEHPDVGGAIENFARSVAVDAASRRENVTFRHFGARASEAGPTARCLDVYLRGENPRRQLGCATMLERRVFVVMMLAPEGTDIRRGLRDPLLAVTMRLIGALAGSVPEAPPAEVEEELPVPPAAAPPSPAPRRPAPRPARPPLAGPMWRT
ncbi:hypothetical protein J8J14_08750 [Roseomonas sp. SSH11]|uniref:Lipoprotein n=1 Tax=Pararoseomonas baculiformis TaxID=2820812 RepID=A0ABS4ACY4_9PROT|nr:hypothetical protein [Pararoseomonas baculiformis]MBP0444872.1 hypothetical protein [Pararoseomonas baculiformis]